MYSTYVYAPSSKKFWVWWRGGTSRENPSTLLEKESGWMGGKEKGKVGTDCDVLTTFGCRDLGGTSSKQTKLRVQGRRGDEKLSERLLDYV
jgi:hypothetical protein